MNPVLLPDAEWFDLASAEGGAVWRIFRSLPRGPAPEGGFPVIYMLDANAGFMSFVEAMRRAAVRPAATGVREAVIVGIGYPEDAELRARRGFDYTAGPRAETDGEGPGEGRDGDARLAGGRDAFLGFVQQVLKPAIAARVAVDPARQTLFGHSLGGWFALDVMTRDPDAFAAYVAVSPSLWWDEARLDEGLARAQGRPARLMLMVGEWEQAPPPGQVETAERAVRRARRAMVDRTRAFARRAAAALGPGGEVRLAVLAEEDHASVLAPAMTRALRFALAG